MIFLPPRPSKFYFVIPGPISCFFLGGFPIQVDYKSQDKNKMSGSAVNFRATECKRSESFSLEFIPRSA